MNKKLLQLIIFSLIIVAVSMTTANAAQFITNERIAIDEKTNDNLYLFGSSVNIDEKVNGDLLIFGNDVNVNANVNGDVMVAGNSVNITGNISGSLRAVGANIFLDGKVGQDVLITSNIFRISSNSKINKDLIMAANDSNIDGFIKRNLKGSANTLVLGGAVGKDVKVNVSKLQLTDSAKIKGNLSYTSLNKAVISKKAKIKGSINRLVPSREVIYSQVSSWLRSLVGMLVVAVILALLAPGTLQTVAKTLIDKPWASPALGFALLLLMPLVIIFIMVTIIGLPLGFILLAIYLGAIYFSQIYVGWAVGAYLMQRINPGKELVVANALVGITFLSLLRLLPVFGFLATLLIIIFGLGAFALAVANWWRSPTSATS